MPAPVVLSTGSTGLTGRDIAVEAITPLFDKKIEGFGELFRAASLEEQALGPIANPLEMGMPSAEAAAAKLAAIPEYRRAFAEVFGEEAVTAHHGSLSKDHRLEAEQSAGPSQMRLENLANVHA